MYMCVMIFILNVYVSNLFSSFCNYGTGLIKLVAGTLAPRPSSKIKITRETPVR
jgi:hypothetical protein